MTRENTGEEKDAMRGLHDTDKSMSGKTEVDKRKTTGDFKEEEFSGKEVLKWVVIGVMGFAVILIGSFFIASKYVHQKEKDLKGKVVKISRNPVALGEKRIVIKQYNTKPFFLRVRPLKGGVDRFLSGYVTMEFIRNDLPQELETQKKILRILIYKQLKRYFREGIFGSKNREKFEKHMVPVLNTFFKGGGVYTVRFKEVEER